MTDKKKKQTFEFWIHTLRDKILLLFQRKIMFHHIEFWGQRNNKDDDNKMV